MTLVSHRCESSRSHHSVLSKLFTTVLNSRINTFCEQNSSISDNQFGFKKGQSTTDAMFVLNSIVQHYLNKNKRLYVAYIDLKKCFDGIYRNGLWLKLYSAGIKGKMLRVVKSMYDKVKSCIRHCSSFSDFFECSVGLRQGEVVSPVLVSLFLNDLETYLQNGVETNITLHDLALIILCFADDMVLLGNSPEELQSYLDLLHNYCRHWSLEVNVDKTKVMVFRKRGIIKTTETWIYNGHPIDIVDSFNYLGTVFNYNGSFKSNIEYTIGKALKALNMLLFHCKRIPLSPAHLCQLFDSFVGSILNYSCELYGFSKSKEIERVHLKFCKRILKVRMSTSTVAVYGELGRYPLYISRYYRIIKYWCRVMNSNNNIVKYTYLLSLNDSLNGCKNWVSYVKKLLDSFGFSDAFSNVIDVKSFPAIFRQRVLDCFVQEWRGSLERNSVLLEYKYFKNNLTYEPYLDSIPNELRYLVTRIRIAAHSLRIHTERFSRTHIPRNDRICLYCNNNDIEDVFHFICVCPVFVDLRVRYIKPHIYTIPSMYKLVTLLTSDNRHVLVNLAKFINRATACRRNLINSVVSN